MTAPAKTIDGRNPRMAPIERSSDDLWSGDWEYGDLVREVEQLREALNQAANDLHTASGLFKRHLPGLGLADDFDQRGRRVRGALLR